MSDFYNNFIFQCAKKNVSASKAAEAVGLSRSAPTGWKSGAIPSDANIQKLANYFGCESADLTGQTKLVAGGISTTKSEDVVFDIEKVMKQKIPTHKVTG